MTQNWRDWCRFCGKSSLTIKYECSVNVKYTFEISETIVRICEPCKLYITEFEDFREKSKRVSQLFHELASFTICSIPSDLNHLREKYSLEALLFDDWKFSDNDDNRLDVKDEFDVNDLELETVIKENLSAQFISELTESESKHKTENSEKPGKNAKSKSNKIEKMKKDDNLTDSATRTTFLLNMVCHICQEKFELYHSIQNHCRKIHNCKPKVLCICGQTISRYGTYIDHKKKHMGDSHVLYLCDHCPRKYYNKPRLIEHILKHGFNGTQSFICSTCGKESISARNLKLHQLRHLPIEEKEKSSHTCPYCGKKFSRGNNLKNHINYAHNSDPNRKDYVCDQCGASFRLKGQLKSHKFTHVDQRTVPCPVCRLAFKTKSQVNCHMRIHGPKLFKCEICFGDYRTKYQLRKHMVCHTNEKDYQCPHCPNAYKRKKDLKCHLCVHTGERPYSCPFCDRTFVNNSNCRKHKLQSHPQELAAYEAEQNKTRKIP